MQPESQTAAPTSPLANLKALRALIAGPLLVLLAGLVFLLVIHQVVVVHRVMPVTRARLVEVHDFLEQQAAAGRTGDVYFLGSSVLLEGVDASMIDTALPGELEAYNLALMGAGAPQWMLFAPALREVKPSLVVMTIDLTGVTGLQTIPEEGMAIAEYWDFFTPEATAYFQSFLSPEQRATLDQPDWKSLLQFRVFPIGAFDMYMREVSREGLRYDGYTTNFKSPWVRQQRISDESIARWIAGKVGKVEQQTAAAMDEQLRLIEALIEWFGREDVACALVVAPVNPRLTAALGDDDANRILAALQQVADRSGAPLLNHKTLLDDSHFADHVHPFEPGRKIWSERLAADLQRLLETPGSPDDTSQPVPVRQGGQH